MPLFCSSEHRVARCEACQGACVTETFDPEVTTSLTAITLDSLPRNRLEKNMNDFAEAVDLRHRLSGG